MKRAKPLDYSPLIQDPTGTALSLVGLRVSVAQLAKRVGVQSPDLPVKDGDLHYLALTQSGGWHDLLMQVTDAFEEERRKSI
jgi:hypothetical protein